MASAGGHGAARFWAAVVMTLVIAGFAFALRFNALGGALAGLDDEDFHNTLSRADLVLAGEQPLRDFNDGDLRGVWPSLTYELPARAQRLWGRNLLPYAILTCGALALCAVTVLLLARTLSRSWVVALLAALAVIASAPKLYNYTKVLSLSVAVAAIRWAVIRPTVPRLVALAVWTVVAALFRHDYGVYVAVGALVGLLASEPRPWKVPVRRMATYSALTLVFSLPSAVWVAYYAGIPRYITDALSAVGAEGRRLRAWPVLDLADPLADSSLIAFNYYVFWVVPFVAVLFLALYAWRRVQLPRGYVATGVALATTTLLSNYFFLRANLPARFGDAVAPLVVLTAWLAGAVPDGSSWRWRVCGQAGAAAILATLCAAFIPMNSIVHEMASGRLSESPMAALARFRSVVEDLRVEPPERWAEKPVERKIAAARYLAECTAPEDRVLLATLADEVVYFARRRIAGGQRRFNGVLTSESDQRLVLERLGRQSVPIVLTDPNYESEFVPDYPLLARYVETRYRDAGVVTDGGTPVLHVWVEKDRRPARTDAVLGFPCFQ